jgi:hypothetical protein
LLHHTSLHHDLADAPALLPLVLLVLLLLLLLLLLQGDAEALRMSHAGAGRRALEDKPCVCPTNG